MIAKADEAGRQSGIFDTAVQSIQLGVEDFQANDPKRASSETIGEITGVPIPSASLPDCEA